MEPEMNEFQELKRKLDEAVQESVILYGTSANSDDERVSELYAEYEAQRIISDLLLSSEVDVRLADLCERYANNEMNEVPLLPKINAFGYSEFKSDVGQLVASEYTPESIAVNVNISPLSEESGIQRDFEFKNNGNKLLDFSYIVTVLSAEMYEVECKLTYLEEEYKCSYTLSESEEIKVCIKMLQFMDPNGKWQLYGVDAYDESFDTNIVHNLGDVIPVNTLVTADVLKMNIPTDKIYQKPSVTVNRLMETYLDAYAAKLQSYGNVTIDVSDASNLEVISINTVDYTTIIDDKEYDYVVKDLEFINKIKAEFLVRAMRNQAAYYDSSSRSTLKYAETTSTSAMQRVFVDTAQTLVSVLDILQKVSKWNEIEQKADFFSAISTMATLPHANLKTIDETSRMTPGMLQQLVNFDSNAGKNDWSVVRSITGPIEKKREVLDSNIAVVYQDEKILVAVKYTIKTAHGEWITKDATGPNRLFNLMTYYDVGTSPREVGSESRNGNDFSIPIQYQRANFEVHIQSVSVLDKAATARISEVTGMIDLTAVFLTKEISYATTTLKGVELVLNDYGTMYGYGIDMDLVLRDSLPTTMYAPIIKGSASTSKINATTAMKNSSGTWVFMAKTKTSVFNGAEDDAFARAEVRTDFGEHSNRYTISGNSAVISDALTAKDVEYAKFKDGKTINDVFNSGEVKIDDFKFALRNIGLQVKTTASYSAQTAPVSLADTFYLNQYNTIQDKVNWQLSTDINEINNKLMTLEEQIIRLQQQVAILQRQVNPPLYLMLANEIIGALTAKLITVATSQALKYMSELVGPLRRVAAEIYAISANAVKVMRPKRRGFYSVDQAAMMTTFIDDVAQAVGKKSELRLKMSVDRPAYKSGIHNLQYFDMSEKIDVVTGYYMRGRISEAINHDLIRPEFNNLSNGIPMPEFKVFYKPLDGLGKIGVPIHNIFTKRDSLRKQLMQSKRGISHRKPSHSFCTYEDYTVLPNGKIQKELTFMGIGEFSGGGSEIGGKIGGITVKYESDAIDRVTGVRVFNPLSYAECGYTPAEVSRMYYKLYKPTLQEISDLPTEKQWSSLVADVDRKVQTSDIMYNTYVPDTGVGQSYKALVKNPPDFEYSLLYNNCQSFTNSLVNFQTRGIIDPSWPNSLITQMMTPRVQFINSMLLESETFMLNAVARAKRSINEVLNYSDNDGYYNWRIQDGVFIQTDYPSNLTVRYIRRF